MAGRLVLAFLAAVAAQASVIDLATAPADDSIALGDGIAIAAGVLDDAGESFSQGHVLFNADDTAIGYEFGDGYIEWTVAREAWPFEAPYAFSGITPEPTPVIAPPWTVPTVATPEPNPGYICSVVFIVIVVALIFFPRRIG
jgi:hypothetical protein